MGSYLNPGSGLFEMALRSQIFVDNERLDRKNKPLCADTSEYMCVSRSKKIWKIYGCGYAGCLL